MVRFGGATAPFRALTDSWKKRKKAAAPVVSPPPPPPPRQSTRANVVVDREARATIAALVPVLSSEEMFGGNGDHEEMKTRRISMWYLYNGVWGSPPEHQWGGRDGVISDIMRRLDMPEGSRDSISNTLHAGLACRSNNTIYRGERTPSGGQNKLLDLGDREEVRLLARVMHTSRGGGIHQAVEEINAHRQRVSSDGGYEEVTYNSVYSMWQRLHPVESTVKKQKDGDASVTSGWARHRLSWVRQLLIRVGLLDPEDKRSGIERDPATCEFPPMFDKAKLDAIERDTIFFCDESHKKCETNDMAAGEKQYRVTVDEHGYYDSTNGSLPPEQVETTHKFDNEARLCYSVASLKDAETGERVAVRCEPYSYTGQNIIPINDWDEALAAEIARVKELSPTNDNRSEYRKWVTNARPSEKNNLVRDSHGLFEDDELTRLDGVGPKTAQTLISIDVRTLGDIASLDSHQKILAAAAKGANLIPKTKKKICNLISKLQDQTRKRAAATPGGVLLAGSYEDKSVDHTKANNPYLSRFGTAEWKSKIREAPNLKGLACITELLLHVVESCGKASKGTTAEHTFRIYHDALTFLRAMNVREWMATTEYEGRKLINIFIFPLHPVDTKAAKQNKKEHLLYSYPPGNSPELMPLDTCLFADVQCVLRKSVAFTRELDENNPLKLSMRTPKQLEHALRTVWRCCPSDERIHQDIDQWYDSLVVIKEASGVVVHGLGNRKGHRHQQVEGSLKGSWGGKRTKGESSKRKKSSMVLPPGINAAFRDTLSSKPKSVVVDVGAAGGQDHGGDLGDDAMLIDKDNDADERKPPVKRKRKLAVKRVKTPKTAANNDSSVALGEDGYDSSASSVGPVSRTSGDKGTESDDSSSASSLSTFSFSRQELAKNTTTRFGRQSRTPPHLSSSEDSPSTTNRVRARSNRVHSQRAPPPPPPSMTDGQGAAVDSIVARRVASIVPVRASTYFGQAEQQDRVVLELNDAPSQLHILRETSGIIVNTHPGTRQDDGREGSVISADDIFSLGMGNFEYINDSLIEGYMGILRGVPEFGHCAFVGPNYFAFYFPPPLRDSDDLQYDYEGTRNYLDRWGSLQSNKTKIIFTIHHDGHFVTVVVELETKKVCFFDSLSSSRQPNFQLFRPAIVNFLRCRAQEKNEEFAEDKWKFVCVDCHNQYSSDCGLFALLFAEACARECSSYFTQAWVNDCNTRERLALSLLVSRPMLIKGEVDRAEI